MGHSEETVHVNVIPADKAKIWKLWRTALIMLGITILEFIIAFTLAHGQAKVWIFVIMTIVKAYYIVAEFMHLKHEVKVLIWSILIPMVFVVWMLVAFIYEGFSIHAVR